MLKVPAGFKFQTTHNILRFEVFTAVTLKNAVFWNVTPCGLCKNRRFGETHLLHHQDDSVPWLLDPANVVRSSRILITPMMEMILSPETLVFTRATRRHIAEDGILQHVCSLRCKLQKKEEELMHSDRTKDWLCRGLSKTGAA
jgi:hypothetical protein